MSIRLATKAAQTVLRSSATSLVVDGVWGPKTENVYVSASESIKSLTNKTVEDAGYTLKQVRSRVVGTMAGGDPYIRELVAKKATELGVPVATAMKIAYLESRFRASAVSSSGASGVFQMTNVAIRDVNEKMGTSFTKEDMSDPVRGITAGLYYIKIAARYMGVELNQVIPVYMAFNIGASAAKKVLAGNPNDASREIAFQAYGTPDVYAKNLSRAVLAAPTA